MLACPSCGRKNEDHYRFCLGCGTPLQEARRARAAAPASPPPQDPLAGWGADPASGWTPNPPKLSGPPLAEQQPAPDSQPMRPSAPLRPVRPVAPPPPKAAPSWSPSAPISSLASGPSQPMAPGPLAAQPNVRRCHNCGAPLPDGFVFCGQCGARWLDSPAAANTVYLSGGPLAEERAIAKLVVLRPDGAPGDSIALPPTETKLGRDAAVPFPADRLLSPIHASFIPRGGRLYIRDEGSLNGVFVKLVGERELQSGAVFRIGQQLLRYDDKRDVELLVPPVPGDDTYVLGSPDLGYWGRLVQILTRSRAGNVFLLSGGEVTLGRERAQIAFPFDGFVSSNHAALVRRGERTFLLDRGSSNGTYLLVTGEALLEHGALLLLGQNLLRVEMLA